MPCPKPKGKKAAGPTAHNSVPSPSKNGKRADVLAVTNLTSQWP